MSQTKLEKGPNAASLRYSKAKEIKNLITKIAKNRQGKNFKSTGGFELSLKQSKYNKKKTMKEYGFSNFSSERISLGKLSIFALNFSEITLFSP